ncbi:UNVERIFIED_CONTAM: hypothetical protein FKN15_046872 [Acipenser sinensis]
MAYLTIALPVSTKANNPLLYLTGVNTEMVIYQPALSLRDSKSCHLLHTWFLFLYILFPSLSIQPFLK